MRGQKLPIFSGFGLPAMELSAQIAEGARAPGEDEEGFVVVFAAIGVTQREATFFRRRFADSAALERSVLFLNLADDSTIELKRIKPELVERYRPADGDSKDTG